PVESSSPPVESSSFGALTVPVDPEVVSDPAPDSEEVTPVVVSPPDGSSPASGTEQVPSMHTLDPSTEQCASWEHTRSCRSRVKLHPDAPSRPESATPRRWV